MSQHDGLNYDLLRGAGRYAPDPSLKNAKETTVDYVEIDPNDKTLPESLRRMLDTKWEEVAPPKVAPPASKEWKDFRPPNFSGKDAMKRAFQWLDERHFVVMIGGKPWVANEGRSEDEDLNFSSFFDFERRYCNWKVYTPVIVKDEDGTDKEMEVPKAPAGLWLVAKKRREHSQIILDPRPGRHTDPHAFNLWKGFGIEPCPGDWSTINWHLLHVICGGSYRHYDWLVGWIARCVQQPEAQGEVGVVLCGKKGTGKGAVGTMLKRIFGRHIFHVTSAEHFLGRFNGHLMKSLFLFVDEAFWAGAKRNEGRLKAMVTESELAFEGKYQPTLMMPNRLKIMMASNEAWVVPATADERRYFVLNVDERRKGDRAYFDNLFEAINGAEMSAFLDYLLNLDLSNFDFRNPPHTDGLNQQKLQSLKGFERFWFDVLWAGVLPDCVGWASGIPKVKLHEAYVAARYGSFPQSMSEVGKLMAQMVPELENRRPKKGDRQRVYVLPDLDVCRTGFLKHMAIDDFTWPGGPVEAAARGPKKRSKMPETAAESRESTEFIEDMRTPG